MSAQARMADALLRSVGRETGTVTYSGGGGAGGFGGAGWAG